MPCKILLPYKDCDSGTSCTSSHIMNTGLINSIYPQVNLGQQNCVFHIHESTDVIEHDVSAFCCKMPYEFTGIVNS